MNPTTDPAGVVPLSQQGVNPQGPRTRSEELANQLPEIPTYIREKMKPYRRELAAYVRELPRLVKEGEAGHYAVLQGDQIHGVWDTHKDAMQYGCEKFNIDTPFLAQIIDPRLLEPFRCFLAENEDTCPSSTEP